MTTTAQQAQYTSAMKLYHGVILTILAGVALYTPFSVYLGSLWPDYYLLFRVLNEVLIGAATILMVWIVGRRHLWRQLWRDWIFRLIVAFAGLNLLTSAVMYLGLEPTLAGLVINLRFLLYFVLVYVLIYIMPSARKSLIAVALISSSIVVAFAVAQLFLPADLLSAIGYSTNTILPFMTVDDNADFIRINSTLRGPNPLGAYAVIILALSASLIALRRRQSTGIKQLGRLVALGAGGTIALWASYSRSALLGAFVAMGLVCLIVYSKRMSARSWLLTTGAVFGLLAVGLLFRDSDFAANVIFHDDPDTGAVITSNDGHLDSLINGTQMMLTQPLGTGVGSTGSASLYGSAGATNIIENNYLLVAHETGWLGLVLFVAIFVMVLRRLWISRSDWLALGLFSSGVGLAIIGILLPVWVDITVSITWWGLAAVVLSQRRRLPNS